jgi:hypothetical protein
VIPTFSADDYGNIAPEKPLTGRTVRNRKVRVDKCHRLDITQLRRDGALVPTPDRAWLYRQEFTWGNSEALLAVVTDSGQPVAVVVVHEIGGTGKRHAYPVELTSTPCNYGGSRLWFLCPLVAGDGACRRRCRTLFLPYGASHFGCRECHRLTYESRQRHRDHWYEGFGRMLALEREELRRPFCTLSPKESRLREKKRKRVSDAMKRFNKRREFQ